MKNKFDVNNYFSLSILDYLGNNKPSNTQIDFVESLLSTTLIRKLVILNENLSEREQTCLYLAAIGKNTSDTATLMNITKTTVASHRKSILYKLNAKNMVHAVYLGIRYGQIPYIEGTGDQK